MIDALAASYTTNAADRDRRHRLMPGPCRQGFLTERARGPIESDLTVLFFFFFLKRVAGARSDGSPGGAARVGRLRLSVFRSRCCGNNTSTARCKSLLL